MCPNPWAQKELSVSWNMGSILRLGWVVLMEVSWLGLFCWRPALGVCSLPNTGRGCIMQPPRRPSLLLAMANASLAFADELAAEEKG